MAPRGNPKPKRGPEEWNPKKRKSVMESSLDEDGGMAGESSKSRAKFPPGPDPATAVTEEFFRLPPKKSVSKTPSPSVPVAPTSRAHVSFESGDVPESDVVRGGEGKKTHIRSTSPEMEIADELDFLFDGGSQGIFKSVSDNLGVEQIAEPLVRMDNTSPAYGMNDCGRGTRSKKNEDVYRSPHRNHRSSRHSRRYSTSDSDESYRRRRRSHRSRRHRSRRSRSRSSSRSSSDRGGRRRSFNEDFGGRKYDKSGRPRRDEVHAHSENDFYSEDHEDVTRTFSREHLTSRPSVEVNPSARVHELKNPFRSGSDDQRCPTEDNRRDNSKVSRGGECTLNPFTLRKESADRKDRRDREKIRDDIAAKRVQAGKKKYLVHVNQEGRCYGLGVGTWLQTLGKLVRGLDPSYIDIRHQPFHLMETLIARLNDDFDYSDTVNPAWLRGRIGGALSSYRHELIKIIDGRGERPVWVSEEIWSRLVTMAGSEKFKKKSEQMKRANACRKSKGRTGPIGIVGITERLRLRLGRTPDPEEVQEEAQRDKSGDRRPRIRPVDGVQSDSGGPLEARAPMSGDDSHEELGETAPASNQVSNNFVSTAETPAVDAPSKKSPSVDNAASSQLNDIDLEFAWEHPLGKILLKQLAELQAVKGCRTPDVQMVLDGLASQIRTLRKNSELESQSNRESPMSVTGTGPTVNRDGQDKSRNGPSVLERTGACSTQDDDAIPPVDAPAAAFRRSGRVSKKKNFGVY